MSDQTNYSQAVAIDRTNIPPHLQRYANSTGSVSLNVDDEQPIQPSLQHVIEQQSQFNARDEAERISASNVTLQDVRNLRRHQNALFRPTARIGNERRVSKDNPIGQLVALENGNMPASEILCALDKQDYMRAQVDRRIAEAKAAGFRGNDTLERARAMRTGTLVPRKTNNNGSGLLVGNNQPVRSGGASSTASYEIGHNESNNFLRRMTGVEFEGEKCQRMARKERGVLAPTPMPEPPPGFLPGGGRFLTERERLDYTFDNPHLAANFIKPQKPINPRQWTDRPVSYRPPIRYNLADEIPFEEPHNRGVFVQPEPIGSRSVSDDTIPFNGMPGENYGAVEQMQIRAPRDTSIREKLRKNVGPTEPPMPFSTDYDDVPVAREERLASYTIVKPKVEKEHLAQGSVDSIQRGIQLVDESALYDPTVFRPLGMQTGALERDERARVTEQKSAAAAKQQFDAARLIGDNETFTAGTMAVDLTGQRAAAVGAQRESSAAEEYQQRSNLHSNIAVGGDPTLLQDTPLIAALERGMMQAPQDNKYYLRQKMRETQSMQGNTGANAAAVDETRFVDVGHATVSKVGSIEQEQRTTAREKLALLKSKINARRANAFDDDLMFEDTSFSRQAADAITAAGNNVTAQKLAEKDRVQSQRNFQRVCDALQRVRLTVTDTSDDPTQDFSGIGDRIAEKMALQTKAQRLSEKTRQLEKRMMQNASDSKLLLDESKFIDNKNSLVSSTATTAHRDQGIEGARLREKERSTIANARQNLNRATIVTDDAHFTDAATRAAEASQMRTVDMKDSISASRVRANEAATLEQARFQMQRQNAFDDVEPQTIGLVQQSMQTSLQDGRKLLQKEQSVQSRMSNVTLDSNVVGDNVQTRLATDNMQTIDKIKQQNGAARAAKSMESAAASMQAQNFGSGLDLQNVKMATQQDIRAIDTNRQALVDQRIMAQTNSRFTALDETNTATMFQESLISGGGEGARRARIKGEDRERAMYVTDCAARQALRVTDSGMFEHHTIDESVGSEPRGGRAAFDRRTARREELAQDTPRVTYDAFGDVATVEHILQRLDATRCDKPSAALYAQRQEAHEKELARLERGPPLHILPPHMFPGGKKIVTPRGSPVPSPSPSPVPR